MKQKSSYNKIGKFSLITYHLSLITSIVCLSMMFSIGALAQGGTLSPYSQYGLGELAPQGGSVNRSMNGLGIALHGGTLINPVNPASFSSVDSLTMLFDMGISGQITNFNENGTKTNAKGANFEFVMGSFRAFKNVGVTFGVLPLTNVGYKYQSTTYLQDVNTAVTTTHYGDGGLHQLFLGVGARPVKSLSIGASVAYLWGGYDRSVTSVGSSTINNLSKIYSASVKNYTLDLGMQYDKSVGKDGLLTVGLTYGFGHKLNTDAECLVVSTNSTVSKADTTRMVVENALELPHTFGAGVSYSHAGTWMVGADVQLQSWVKTKIPNYENGQYVLSDKVLNNSYKFTLGGEWCPQWNSRNFFRRVRYRAGVGYITPYYKINGQEGPRQMSASVGFGIPIMNGYNSRSQLTISAQYVNNSATGLIKENIFRLNIGFTFNEKWFAKWKIE